MPTSPEFADATLQAACGGDLLATSVSMGWRSVLLEHRELPEFLDPCETKRIPDFKVGVFVRGEGELRLLQRGRWRSAWCTADTVYLRTGDPPHHIGWSNRPGGEVPEVAHLFVPPTLFEQTAEYYRRPGGRLGRDVLHRMSDPVVVSDPVVAHTVLALLQATRVGAPDLYAASAAQWLTTHLLAAHGGGAVPATDRRTAGTITDRRLARVTDYMRAHLAAPLTLDVLAREAHVSKFHLVRLFRGRTGVTPHAFLVGLRLDAGRRLLAATNQSVGQVATACGYASAAAFGAAFRSRFGETPSDLRRRHHV